MSQPPQFILFSVFLGLFFVAMDVYVLHRWNKFTRRHSLRSVWRVVPLVLSITFVLLYSYYTYRRLNSQLDGGDVVMFGLISLWFMPKMILTIILLFKDASKLFLKFVSKIGKGGRPISDGGAADLTSRRAFLEKAGWTAASVPFIVAGNGLVSTIYDYQVLQVEIPMKNLPRSMDGMKVVQISDVHAGSYPDHKPFQEALRLINAQQPDLITITGDFVNTKPKELAVIAKDLSKMKAPFGVYGSLGNHDHYNTIAEHEELKSSIRELGIDLLVNDHRRIGQGEASLILAGTDNTGFRQNFADLDKTLVGVESDEPTILLAHDPTLWDKQIVGKAPVDLMLSGHTHGGQLGISLLGFEWSHAQLIYEQWAGLYYKGDQAIYVNRGLGTVGPPIRVGIRPEITVFTLRSASISENLT